MAYAENTSVPVLQSLTDIEREVNKRGGSGFQLGVAEEAIAIMFAGDDRRVRFTVQFGKRPGTTRDVTRWEKQKRALCRALLLTIKAKFVSIESGIETFEETFLAQTVMPDGKTVMEHTKQPILEAYEHKGSPRNLLPDYSK